MYSRLFCGIAFWGLTKESKSIFLAQKHILRYIVGVGSRESCGPLFKRFNILPLPSIYIFGILGHCFNKPGLRNSDVHNFGTRYKNDFVTPFNTLTLIKKAPVSMGLRVFNLLPVPLKLGNFKNLKALSREFLWIIVYTQLMSFRMC